MKAVFIVSLIAALAGVLSAIDAWEEKWLPAIYCMMICGFGMMWCTFQRISEAQRYENCQWYMLQQPPNMDGNNVEIQQPEKSDK